MSTHVCQRSWQLKHLDEGHGIYCWGYFVYSGVPAMHRCSYSLTVLVIQLEKLCKACP